MDETLNLTNEEKSTIKFKVSQFPDGQQTIDLIGEVNVPVVTLTSRLSNFKDLELILCATAALKEEGVIDVHLNTPYFIGSRSDRKFLSGGINYLKTVICPIINNADFASVTVMDPHSDVLEACLNNYIKVNNFDLVQTALQDISNNPAEDVTIVSPDAGALKKIFDVAQEFKIPNVLVGIKHRDVLSGNITHSDVQGLDEAKTNKFLIIDDICDGGRTFLELAKVIKAKFPKSECYLVVTHGIFSKGFIDLDKYLEKIYTTNSIDDITITNHDGIKSGYLNSRGASIAKPDFVHQTIVL